MQRRVQIAGLGSSVPTSGMALAWLGLVLALLGAALAWYGGTASREAAATAFSSKVASDAVARSLKGGAGDPAELAAFNLARRAAAQAAQVNPLMLPSARAQSSLSSVASQAPAALGASMTRAVDAVEILGDAMRKSIKDLDALAGLVASGKAAFSLDAYGAAADSIGRLLSYADSAVSLRSLERIDYDVRNVVRIVREVSGSPRFAADRAGPIVDAMNSSMLPLVSAARAAAPPREEMARWNDAMRALGESLGSLAAGAETALRVAETLVLAGAALIAVGSALMFGASRMGLQELDARFRRATAHFRRSEEEVARLAADASRIAGGDFALEVKTEFDDDGLRAIAGSLNTISQSVRKTAAAVGRGMHDMEIEVAKVTEKCVEVSSADPRRQEKLRVAETALGDVRQITETVELDSRGAASKAQVALDSVHLARAALREAVEGAVSIRGALQESAKRVKGLGEKSQEAVRMIEAVSAEVEHIHVVAMNASLEAERVDGRGGGFAVVAKELSRLAEQIDARVRALAQQIQAVQSDTREAGKAVEFASQRVVSGAGATEDASGALDVVQVSAQSVDSSLSSLSAAHAEAVRRARVLAGAIDEIGADAGERARKVAEVGARVAALGNSVRAVQAEVAEHQ